MISVSSTVENLILDRIWGDLEIYLVTQDSARFFNVDCKETIYLKLIQYAWNETKISFIGNCFLVKQYCAAVFNEHLN
jgi:hypothetical protein